MDKDSKSAPIDQKPTNTNDYYDHYCSKILLRHTCLCGQFTFLKHTKIHTCNSPALHFHTKTVGGATENRCILSLAPSFFY